MQVHVLMSLRTNSHSDRHFTMNDLIEREPFSRYKFGRNIINQEKSKITNIIRDDTGMSNGQVITLSNFPFNFDMIFFLSIFNHQQVLENKSRYEYEQDLIL